MKVYQPLIEKYSRQATYYDRRWNLRWGEATLRTAIEAIPLEDLKRVLDVGCGTGMLELAVSPRLRSSHSLVGVDIALPMLQLAQQKLEKCDRISWTNAPAEQLPFESATFDGLVCNNSFHYYRQPLPVLKEFHRVLQPGGSLVLSDWCNDFPACKVSYWLLRLAHHTYIHRYALSRIYGLDEISELLFTAGFNVTSTERVGMDLGWGIMVLRAQA
ncbi:MAG: methyltransferase domain-containing protein [Acidobacteria bacterium]|nr:methyltransferase domain-containing protein [Acidobacteriota bacterium]